MVDPRINKSSFTELIIEIKQKDQNKYFYEVYITE